MSQPTDANRFFEDLYGGQAGGSQQTPQQDPNPGAPNTGGFDDFDDEIPFAPMHSMADG